MTLKTIYIARHGYRANWLPPPHPPNPTGVDSDPPLAEHGVEQAQQLAAYFTGVPAQDKPEFILSSPFYRCVQTSQPIAEMLLVPIVLERGIGEWYKRGRSVVPEPANYDLLSQFFTKLNPEVGWERDGLEVIPNLEGESEEEIFERCQAFWKKFVATFEERFPKIETVLLMTHAATKIALGMSLLGKSSVHDYLDGDKTRLRAGACSLDKYIRNEVNESDWLLKMNGNCEFLSKGEEMAWNFQSGFEAGSDADVKARAAAAAANGSTASSRGATPGAVAVAGKSSTPTPEPSSETGEEVEMEEFYVTIDVPIVGEAKFSQFQELAQLTTKSFSTKSTNLTKQSIRASSQVEAGVENGAKNNKPSSDTIDAVRGLSSLASRSDVIKKTAELQIAGIESGHPLIKLSNNGDITNSSSNSVDGKVYQGDWRKLVGTDMLFDDFGELIGVVREHIVCDNINVLVPKETKTDTVEDDELVVDEQENEVSDDTSEIPANSTSLFKKMYLLSKKKADK